MKRRTLLNIGLIGPLSAYLTACRGVKVPISPASSTGKVIDIHAHIFNARDLPIQGFLEKVILKDKASSYRGLLILLRRVLQKSAPSFSEEFDFLESLIDGHESSIQELDFDFNTNIYDSLLSDLAIKDINAYENLIDELGIDPEQEAGGAILGTIIERVINWGVLLTKYRVQIANKMMQTYPEVSLFTPSIVDFDSWVEADKSLKTSILEQVKLYGMISEWSNGRIHGFVGYDPFQQLTDPNGEAGNLAVVKEAINKHGFIGVKLYPPMGFKPIGNKGLWPEGDRRNELDKPLNELYQWCIDNHVPILTHTNESNGAGDEYSKRASPKYWKDVLEIFPDLRLCFGHLGGFGDKVNAINDWPEQIFEIIKNPKYRFIYADISYHTPGLKPSPENDKIYTDKLKKLIGQSKKAANGIVYGSDWQMILKDEGHNGYYSSVRKLIQNAFGDAFTISMFEMNSRSFLGLDDADGTRSRIIKFYKKRGMNLPTWL